MSLFNRIVLLSTIVMFSSCGLPYCKKTIFDKNELLWISPYNQGDKILFQSSNNKLDTLIITEKKLYNPSNHFIFDLCACNWLEGDNLVNANGSLYFKFSNYNRENNSLFDGIFNLYKKDNKKSAEISFSLLGLYTKEFDSISFDKIMIRNKQLNDCIILDHRNSEITEGKSDIAVQSFIWSKHLGLVQYVLHSGEKFEYVGHIK